MLKADDDCFKCKHCGKLPDNGMDVRLIEILNDMAIQADDINSAYRCPVHNANVGGVENSTHVRGVAVDVDASEYGVDFIANMAAASGADGIGRYYTSKFVHIDTRGEWARW